MTAVLEPATPARRVAPDGTASARARSGRTPGLRSTPAQQRRIPWIALGLLLVFGAGLAFAAWSRSASSRVPVLVAAADVAAGETVQPEALATAEVNVGAGVRTIPASERGRLTGQVARGPIPAGTLITPEMLTDGSAVPAGQAVVGAVLALGAYPTASLRAGDAVLLMEASPATDPVVGARELGSAQVWAVSTPEGPGASGLFVSLLVPVDQAAAASNAASRQQLRLVLVGGGS